MADQQPDRTVLYQSHVDLGARLGPFGGWSMPIQYVGITQEHHAVRNGVGVFDVSHMGQFAVSGDGARTFLDELLPGNVLALTAGQIIYSPLCNPSGGVVDDVLLYCLDESNFLLVVNAARIATDWDWVVECGGDRADLKLDNVSDTKGMLAVQGPTAEALLQGIGVAGLECLNYFSVTKRKLEDAEFLISRSGYTGEDGFEIICEAGNAVALWESILSAGAQPCGLGARDTLRTEMGYCLYGHELNEQVTPFESGIGWTVQLDKAAAFVGKKVLRERKASRSLRRLRGLRVVDKGIPRAEQSVLSADGGDVIGRVSSGTFSPSLQRGIALAFLERDFGKRGTIVLVDIRGKMCKTEVAGLPLVPSNVKRTQK